MMNGGGPGNGMGTGFFGPGIMGILLVIIVIAVIAVAMVLFKNKSNHNTANTDGNNSLGTLKERLARGEILEEEYNRLKQKLEQ